MKRPIAFVAGLVGPVTAVGCFQELDPVLVGDPSAVAEASTFTDGGPSDVTVPTLPDGFDLDAALTRQCGNNTSLCYQLCGSPSCALADNFIPPQLDTPVILLPDGAMIADQCSAVEQEAVAIRTRSCAPCHNGPPGLGSFNYVLDDAKLSTSNSATYTITTDAGKVVPRRMVVPGDPADSWLYVRASTGQMPPMPNTAKTLIGANAAAAIVYPTAQDISNLFAWIMCLAADAGSPYASSYYGGDYGPATTSHADAGAAGAAAADAGGD